MKCPKCNSKNKVDLTLQCDCGYRFTFNPTSVGITDGKFLAAVRSASRNNTYFFTENQLYTALCRKSSTPILPPVRGCLFLITATFLTALIIFYIQDRTAMMSHFTEALFVVVILFVILLFIVIVSRAKILARKDFDSLLKEWNRTKGPIEKMLVKTSLHQPPPAFKEPDIYDYGVENILVVDRDILVDVFVKNSFHAQQHALVISINRYPAYLLAEARKALDANPRLTVFLLHDSTEAGKKMSMRMMNLNLPIKNHPVVDLGLFTEDVKQLRILRSVSPKESNYEILLDLLPYPYLANLVSSAITAGTPFAALSLSGRRGEAENAISYG